MTEIEEQLTRFRDTVPVGVTPRAEHLFRAALQQEHDQPERTDAPPRTHPLSPARPGWRRGWRPGLRLGIAVSVAAALVAGIVIAVQPSAPVTLTAQLLADRASAAALAQPMVSPGQWVYRVTDFIYTTAEGARVSGTEADWETADGGAFYGGHSQTGYSPGDFPGYSQLGSLPTAPAALDAYLERTGHGVEPAQNPQVMSAFVQIDAMLSNYVLPPALEAEMYQALALLPGIEVDSHVTILNGQSGVAFALPTWLGGENEIVLDPSTYAFVADAHGRSGPGPGGMDITLQRMVIVGAPGSTTPSLTPPTEAERLAELADRAYSKFSPQTQPLTSYLPYIGPGTWMLRQLVTASGDQTVWATADDSEQASYVNGQLVVCSRSAACARSTQWLMPAGPGYRLVNPVPVGQGMSPGLPSSLPQLLTALNSYSTGCTDVAGDCNAVNVIANIDTGYVNEGLAPPSSFLVLADIPGVTVAHVTDVTGQADEAFRFPFTDGVTEILMNANGYVAGYVRDGSETVIAKVVPVTGPGSLTPVSTR